MYSKLGKEKGSLTIVGTGISVSGQITLISRKCIQQADIVFAAIPNQPGFEFIKSLNANTYTLTDLYEINKKRADTYHQMTCRITDAVRSGKRVCGAFYGHPGVFVNPSYAAMKELREQGYFVHMEPGISAEDCLIADLGIDPAENGYQSYEASKFLFRRYSINPHMTQIIWQVCMVGDYSFSTQLSYKKKGIELLVSKLKQSYSDDHQVIIYEAKTFPLAEPRIDKLALYQLTDAELSPISTLVVPAIGLPEYDDTVFKALGITPELAEQNIQVTG